MRPSPFKFLDSYGKEDAATFFGREQETDELYARCTHAQTLVIYGRSGTGKTSLVQCGLRSRFDESDWLPIVIRRGSDLNANLLGELRAAALTPSKSTDALELVHNVYLDHFVPVHLIFDQFEEIFIFGDEEEQQTFITTARTLIEQEQHVRLLFIIREEYLAQFTAFEEQVPSILEHRMRVERMPRRRAAEVVDKLCATAGIPVQPGFSAALLDRLSTDGGGVELSYVQVLLDQCWKKREGEEPFSLALLERIGQLDDVLGDLLDEQIGQCSDPRKAEALLKAFVSDQGTKRPLTDPEAEGWMKAMGQPMEVADLQRLSQDLVDRRLLTERDESGRHELRHDALAARIFERITKVEKEVADVRSFVTQAHKQFTKRGQRLAQTDLDYLRPYKHQLHLPDAEERFVEDAFADERDREKRARRKRRWMVAGLLGLMVAGGLFTLRTVNTLEKERRMSESVRSVQRSEELVDSDPQAAYLLAERAFQLDTTVNAERALLRAYNSLFTGIVRFPGTAVMVAPDHRSFLSIDPLNSFSLCDTSGKVIFSHKLIRPPNIGVKYVADGKYLLNVDSTVHLFDLQGKILFKCPLERWWAYNDIGGFIAAYGDSLLIDLDGALVRAPLPGRMRKRRPTTRTSSSLRPPVISGMTFGKNSQSSHRGTSLSIGRSGSDAIYYVDGDSVGSFDPMTGRILHVLAHAPLLSRSVLATDSIHLVDGRVFLATTEGLQCFDPITGTMDNIVPVAVGKEKIQWLGNGIFVQMNKPDGDSPVIWDLAKSRSSSRKFNGFFCRYFAGSGAVLVNDIKGTQGTYTLFDRKGVKLMYTTGRLVGTVNDEFLLHRNHFVIISEASVDEDSVRVYRDNGTLAWSVVVPKVTPHLWYELPALTYDEFGDSVTVCYFHNNVINGRSLQECRMIRNGRTIFYTTREPFYFYWDRFVFSILGSSRMLLSRWRDGFDLVRPMALRPLFSSKDPLTSSLWPFDPAGVGQCRLSGGPDDLHIDLWIRTGDALRTLKLDTHDPELISALKVCSRRHGTFSANGDYFTLWVAMDSLASGGREFIWRTKDGSVVNTKWTRGPFSYWRRAESHSYECLDRNDSLLILDKEMKELLWSTPIDRMKFTTSSGQDRYATLYGPNGHVRIIDLDKRTTHDVFIDTTRLDAEVKAAVARNFALTVVVENDSVIDLLTAGRLPVLIQRVVNGKPKNVITVNGMLNFLYDRGAVYMNVSNFTAHRAFNDVEFFGNFTRSLYRLDTREDELVLIPVLIKNVFNHEAEAESFRISRYDVSLFEGGLNSFSRYDEHTAVSTHRLIDHYELFPKDAETVIQYVREKKVYGEFWKYMDTETLFKEPE